MKKNIFLIGLNEFNRAKLESLENSADYKFHSLLEYEEVVDPEEYDIKELIGKAEKKLKDFDGSIDAIIGYMDFPVSTMVPILCKKLGVRSSSVESFLKCEHKYWSRIEQKKAIPDNIPDFYVFDPFSENPIESIKLPYPFWIKPVKSFGSHLGFKIHNKKEFDRAVSLIKESIGRIGEPFDDLLEYADVDLPEEIEAINSNYCLAESIIGGRQCTIEGCVYNGEFHSHGVVDSIRYPHKSVFFRYQYPSQLPASVQKRMKEIGEKLLKHLDYNNSAFNMEFFWDKTRDKIWFLEINTRVAQHHSDLFQKVDGVSNHQVPVDLALDKRPLIPSGKGKHDFAAAIFYREFQDAIVENVPDDATIKQIQQTFPDTVVQLDVEKGMRLSDLPEQDSYSFICALIYMGSKNQQELLANYKTLLKKMDFRFSPLPDKQQPPFVGENVDND